MPLFAQQLCVDDSVAPPRLPGRYDDARGLRVTDKGDAVAAAIVMPTRADRDKIDDAYLATVTKAARDNDDQPSALFLTTKTAGGIDQDDDRLLMGTTTFAGPDKDD